MDKPVPTQTVHNAVEQDLTAIHFSFGAVWIYGGPNAKKLKSTAPARTTGK